MRWSTKRLNPSKLRLYQKYYRKSKKKLSGDEDFLYSFVFDRTNHQIQREHFRIAVYLYCGGFILLFRRKSDEPFL